MPGFGRRAGAGIFFCRCAVSVSSARAVGHRWSGWAWEKVHPHLFALHRRIQDAVLDVGLEPDLRAFHPHVTVGRAKGISREALQPLLRRHAETEFGLIKVTGFELYSSLLAAGGATHRLEMRQEF